MVEFELSNEASAPRRGGEAEEGTLHRLASLKAQPGSHHHFSDVEVCLPEERKVGVIDAICGVFAYSTCFIVFIVQVSLLLRAQRTEDILYFLARGRRVEQDQHVRREVLSCGYPSEHSRVGMSQSSR